MKHSKNGSTATSRQPISELTTSQNATPLIGVGIDTARYGHHVTFLRQDKQPAAEPMTVTESREGYDALYNRLTGLQDKHCQTRFSVRIDAAGQYATNLERYLQSLPLPMSISIGEPKRNKDYCQVHYPKRKADPVESHAMARYAVVEQPAASPRVAEETYLLREIAGRLQAQVGDTTRSINRLHNLLARVFPELAVATRDISAAWVLELLKQYPTPEKIARAKLATLTKIAFLSKDKAVKVQEAARQTVGTMRGEVVQSVVREFVGQVIGNLKSQNKLEKMLLQAYRQLPPSGHLQVETIPGIGLTTAAVLVAKMVSIDRFETPGHLVGYFGVFPQEHSSGVDRQGRPLRPANGKMSAKGSDIVRRYLWNAAMSAMQHNPAVRALYKRLRARGTRGDVAMGHCMRKLLHLVFAVWKSDRPFDKDHYPWEQPTPAVDDAKANGTTERGIVDGQDAAGEKDDANKMAAGHKGDVLPLRKVVTATEAKLSVTSSVVNPVPAADPVTPVADSAVARPAGLSVDYGHLRGQISIERVLRHLGHLDRLRGGGPQRRGPCPVHGSTRESSRSFSVNLKKNVFQCFNSKCAAAGNALDLWALLHAQPLHQAALDMASTFNLELTVTEKRNP